MKKSIALIVAVAVTAAAFAGPVKPPTTAPKTITCAVMSTNKVNIADATKKHMYADYKGRRYFFCCGGCPDAFKKDPSKFKGSASIPIPKHS